jgi:hypothetical protein
MGVKPSVPCRTILRHVKYPYEYEEILHRQNSVAISREVSLALLLDVSACNCQRALVDESGMIRTQIGRATDQK